MGSTTGTNYNFDIDEPEIDMFTSMQNMAGKMQKKLETVGTMLNEANKARQLVEAKLVKTQEDAKNELAATKAADAAELERLKQKLEGELEDTKQLYEGRLDDLRERAMSQENTLKAAISKLEGELNISVGETEGLRNDLEELVANFDTAAASATITVEKRLAAAAKATKDAKAEKMEAEIMALKSSLLAAETKAAEAMSDAELRLVDEVSTAVSEATNETELMAVEASVAAEAASKRALSVEKQLQHQAMLLKTVRTSRESENSALKALENSQQQVLALTNETSVLQDKMREAQTKARTATARADESERFMEQKTKGLVQRAERAMEVALRDRDQAVKAANEAQTSSRSTITALTKRAEAAEGQLLWQEEVLARCAEAEAAHKEALASLLALEDEQARLKNQLSQLEAEKTLLEQDAAKLLAELQSLQELIEERVAAAELRAEEAVTMSAATVATTEANSKLQRESDLAKVEELESALETAKQKGTISQEASGRNIAALRKALSTVSACADSWRMRAQVAEERVEVLRTTLDVSEKRSPKKEIQPSETGLPKSFMEVFQENQDQTSGDGRMSQNCAPSELRKILAKGPRVEDSSQKFKGDGWSNDNMNKDDLYTRETLDFKSAAGIVLPRK
eukprot:CAMPEP_0196572760 /NCGR_PEP_ID=MMETSP1081-20130531/2747_1 /TAXON_ID=36882 /ORGANISM="Pyramimonas amylifera, Strain CCMP720" /LENGTH=631 /DNA_ID=CAMNT_0041890185 /DNA_START=633 /DNA_END=2528 /DNA_ORIENTATION=-